MYVCPVKDACNTNCDIHVMDRQGDFGQDKPLQLILFFIKHKKYLPSKIHFSHFCVFGC